MTVFSPSTHHQCLQRSFPLNSIRCSIGGRVFGGYIHHIVLDTIFLSDTFVICLYRRSSRRIPFLLISHRIPHTYHAPSQQTQLYIGPVIPGHVHIDLMTPEISIAFGIWKCLQSLCPCQKHPSINITVRYFRSTMSGEPGSLRLFTRYRRPLEKRNLRTIISGFVSFPFMAAMHRLRCSP